MKQLRPPGLLLLLLLALPAGAAESEPPRFHIESVRGDVSYDLKGGVAVITNGVIVRYAEAVLTADNASLNQDTGEVRAQGNVVLTRNGHLWRGEALFYNFKTRQMGADSFRVGLAPFFAEGQSVFADQTNQLIRATQAYVTTDDVADPGYRIRGKTMTVVPGRYAEFKNATLYLGSVPVFFWPYYRHNLGQQAHKLTPGYRSAYGPYLLYTYTPNWGSNFVTEFHVDYRAKRGVGVGPTVTYDLGSAGHGKLDYYFAHDNEPGTNDTTGLPIDPNRHRLAFQHDVTLATNFYGKAVVNYQSDPQFIRDFFESEYNRNPMPGSFVDATRFWPNYSLSVLAQPKVNDFFDTVERLPDVKLTAARQQLGPVPVFYEGESSVGWFRNETNGTPPYSAWRADTFHQLLYPQTLFGWLNLTPRVAGRFTHYSEADGDGATTTDADRWIFNTGAELSFKASRVWRNATNRLFDVNGLRHIVEPMFNYSYTPTPNKRPLELPQFDALLPSLRPQPIDFPRFNSIDSIDSENTLRLGLRNKFQTRRAEGIDSLVDWDLFVDWRLDPRADQQTFGDLMSAMDIKPRSWLTFNSEVRYGVSDGVLREANHTFYIQPGTAWSVAFGHRYFRQDPTYGINSEDNLFTSSVYLRLNENWGFRASHRFEATDGTLEEQIYSLYRDLRSWTAALSFRVREDRTGPSDFGVAVTFSLKAFPSFGLGDVADRPTTLLGY